ncbi:MAG: hypothetical protein IKZ91_04415 [Bacteroidales bacterium]|nr:hypothetical protein [Bacteroidales bacterium]
MKKIYALFLLTATLSACTAEILPEQDNNPETIATYTLTLEATKAYTRALSLDGKVLNATWAEGERVAVYAVTGDGYAESESTTPVGTLIAQGSGTTTTLSGSFNKDYTPRVNAKLRLKFLSADYTGQKGTLDYIAANCDFATADVVITYVDGGVVNTSNAVFANQQAIVKFSLKDKDTDAALAAISLTVKYGSTTYDVTLDDPASDVYVALPSKSKKSVTLAAVTTDGNYAYEKSGVTFEKGKYYGINVKMINIDPAIGKLYYSDGTCSATLLDGKTPIGVVAYIGTDAFSENGVTLRDGHTVLQSHGLVLCLKDAATNVIWGPDNLNKYEFGSGNAVWSVNDLKRTENVSGYMNTKTIAEKANASSDYPAFYQAWNYTELPAPATTTGWFLPSAQQLVRMQTGLGEMNINDLDAFNKSYGQEAASKWDAALSKAGDGNYDVMSNGQSDRWSGWWYWSSTEAGNNDYTDGKCAVLLCIYNCGFWSAWTTKKSTYSTAPAKVRPVLAF